MLLTLALSPAFRRGAKFFKADLQDADFTDANLSNASIENAKLSGVKLTNAILKNAYTGVGLELVKDFTNSGQFPFRMPKP